MSTAQHIFEVTQNNKHKSFVTANSHTQAKSIYCRAHKLNVLDSIATVKAHKLSAAISVSKLKVLRWHDVKLAK